MSKKRRRGRPSKTNAKRNTTTREGRRTGRDPSDAGTAELRWRRTVATGSEDLSHEDPLAELYGRSLLTTAQYNAGRDIAELLAVMLPLHVGNVWQRLLTGTGASFTGYQPSPAAERARFLLDRIASIIGDQAVLVFAVCSGSRYFQQHEAIAEGLDRVSRRWSK